MNLQTTLDRNHYQLCETFNKHRTDELHSRMMELGYIEFQMDGDGSVLVATQKQIDLYNRIEGFWLVNISVLLKQHGHEDVEGEIVYSEEYSDQTSMIKVQWFGANWEDSIYYVNRFKMTNEVSNGLFLTVDFS